MDKYNNSADAFFLGLVHGVEKFVQSEGGSPGAPEMSFLYELGLNEFVQNVANLLHKPDRLAPKRAKHCYVIIMFRRDISCTRLALTLKLIIG